jgi:hypothetical protein
VAKQQGFIFALTLSMLLIISLLVCTSLQQLFIYDKAIKRQEQASQQQYQLERVAMRLFNTNNLSCIRDKGTASAAFNLLRQHQGCQLQIKQTHYYYLIEDLGVFPCLRIKQTNGASHHFRISVWQQNPRVVDNWLQLRLILSASNVPCMGKQRFIATGISSWRLIISQQSSSL